MIKVIDGFFRDFDSVLRLARGAEYSSEKRFYSGSPSLMRFVPAELWGLGEKLHLKFWDCEGFDSSSNCRFKLARVDSPRKVHKDFSGCMTLVVYLTEGSGTEFFMENGERFLSVEGVPNRAVFFDSQILHSAGELSVGRMIFCAFMHKGHAEGALNIG